MNFGLMALKALQAIFILLDWAIYSLINAFYTVFTSITKIQLFNTEAYTTASGASVTYIQAVANNIYVLLGIVALFKIVFSLIMMVINPDMMNDKQKGGGKLVTRFLVTLVLTIAVPFVFKLAFDLQNTLVDENVIGKILTVGSDYVDINKENESTLNNSSTKPNSGEKVANLLFKSFVTPNTEITTGCDDAKKAYQNLANNDNRDTAGIYEYISHVNDTGKNSKTNVDDFCNKYMWGISTIAGGFAAWVFLIYALDIGIRVVKLSFLQLIAPVPIVSYITSGNDSNKPFNNWTKSCISTYVDLFVRLIIINFVVQVIPAVMESITGVFADVNQSGNNILTVSLGGVAIILGVLAFAQQAPKLIQDMLGVKGDGSNDYGFGLNKAKNRTAAVGMLGAAGAVGISNAAKTTRDSYKANKDAGNNALVSGLKAGVAGMGSSFAGMAKATTVGAGMLGKKDVQMGQIYNKAFSTAVNNRDNRDKRQIAGYSFADNMLDKGRVLIGKDPKAKLMTDTYSNVVSAKQGNASQLRQAAFDFAYTGDPSRGLPTLDQDRINEISSAIKDKDGNYYNYDSKGVKHLVTISAGSEREFRNMLDASDNASLDAIKLGKVRDEMSRVKDNVTSNVKDSK